MIRLERAEELYRLYLSENIEVPSILKRDRSGNMDNWPYGFPSEIEVEIDDQILRLKLKEEEIKYLGGISSKDRDGETLEVRASYKIIRDYSVKDGVEVRCANYGDMKLTRFSRKLTKLEARNQ